MKSSFLTFLCLFIFKLNVLGWHWLIRLRRFQVRVSMVQGLCVALCTRHPQSNHLLSPCSFVWALYPSLPRTPLPSGNRHTVVCVWVLVCLFFLFVHYFLSVLYPTHEWNHRVLNFFCLTLFCLASYSQGPSILLQMAVFHLFLVVLYTCTTSSWSIVYGRTLELFLRWPLWMMPQCT